MSQIAVRRLSLLAVVAVCMACFMPSQASAQVIDIPKTTGIWLELTVDGSKVEGESSQISLDRAGTIECMGYNHEVLAQGGHNEIRIIKRIDSSSPMLHKALDQMSVVSAKLMVFQRIDQGPEFRRFTIEITGGMISGVRGWMPNKLDESVMEWGLLEEVSITYDSLTITDELEGGSHTYDL